MLHRVRGKWNKLNKDNRGSAIVLVIIALAMVGILAATIMWMSMTNYYMKVTDKGNKQGFYSSETVLEQIKAGLEEDASVAASRAYAYILARDYSSSSTADRAYDFKKMYKEYFVDIVCKQNPSRDQYKYDLDHLLEYVDMSIRPVTTGRQTTGKVRYLTTGDALGGGTSGYGKLVYDTTTDMIKLEGLHLEYTDEDKAGNDYVSIIDTDILIMAPDVSFTQTGVLPDVFDYALVADRKFKTSITGKCNVSGSLFAGEKGIRLYNELNVSDAGYLISEGDVTIGIKEKVDDLEDFERTDTYSPAPETKLTITGRDTGTITEFWANDVSLGDGRTSFTTSKVDTYVADDLTLSGRKAKVELKDHGKYTGYGSSDTIASQSSAVVVNGIGSTVHMEGLDNVTLLGRTFVSIPQLWREYDGSLSQDSIDIQMGESIAVKGEQVAFLVPDGCVYLTDMDGNNSKLVSNPFSRDLMYERLADGSTRQIRKIDIRFSDTLEGYVDDPSNGYKPVYPASSNLVYLYMTMTGEKANEYYANVYYKQNLEKINSYFIVYTDRTGTDKKIEVPKGTNMIAEGDFLTAYEGYSTTEEDKIIENSDSQLNLARPSADKAKINADCVRIRNNLCHKLMKEGVVYEELNRELFDNLIRKTEVENLISLNGNPCSFTDESGTYKAVFVKADGGTPYEYSDKNIRVLVVIGDVNINEDFTGLLIASGTVTVKKNGVKITSIINADATGTTELDRMKSALTTSKTINVIDSSLGSTTKDMRALQYFVDGSEYDLDGLRKSPSSTVSNNKVVFTELVKFNNWVKN